MAASSAICALPGCSNSSFPSQDPRNPHITCGRTHHLLLMAARFHPDRPHPAYRQISDRNAAGFCGLPSCTEPPEPGASWCSASHRIAWLYDFYLSVDLDQICRLPGCDQHVFVEENYVRGQFCGLRHEQKYALQSALQHREQEASLPKLQSYKSPPLESACGRIPSVESRINSFRQYLRCGVPPSDIKVDEEFFHKHPWHICDGDEACWLIVPRQNKRNSRKSRLTIEGCHWKQQGKPVTRSDGSILAYFAYKQLKGKKTDIEYPYFLEEYTIETDDSHALVKLHKGSVRRRKRSKCTGIEIHGKEDAQKISTLKDDEMDIDSFLLSLLSSPVLNDLEDEWGLNPEDDWGLNPCPGGLVGNK